MVLLFMAAAATAANKANREKHFSTPFEKDFSSEKTRICRLWNQDFCGKSDRTVQNIPHIAVGKDDSFYVS
jgi:hypothetical protein